MYCAAYLRSLVPGQSYLELCRLADADQLESGLLEGLESSFYFWREVNYYSTLDANSYTRFYLLRTHGAKVAICVARNESESSEIAIAAKLQQQRNLQLIRVLVPASSPWGFPGTRRILGTF